MAGNDTIYNSADSVKANGDAGKDYIYNNAQNVTIDGGSGNDTIIVGWSDDNSINGGAGNDKISLKGCWNNTVVGSKGNDTIDARNDDGWGSAYLTYQYASGDGNDVIYGYDSDDTLNIISGYYSRATVGNNVILTIYNGSTTSTANGAITLVGAKGKAINIDTFQDFTLEPV